MKRFIVIDIETLGTSPKSVILSIGAVFADTSGQILSRFQVFPEIFNQLMQGRTIDTSTVSWWRDQNSAAKLDQHARPREHLNTCLEELRDWIFGHGAKLEIWARGPQFDQVLLENAYEMVGEKPPWKYNQWRDERTLTKLFEMPEVKSGMLISHVAVDDAELEALNIAQRLEKLSGHFKSEGCGSEPENTA